MEIDTPTCLGNDALVSINVQVLCMMGESEKSEHADRSKSYKKTHAPDSAYLVPDPWLGTRSLSYIFAKYNVMFGSIFNKRDNVGIA